MDNYFAALTDVNELGSELMKRVDEGYRHMVGSQLWDRVYRSKNTYWGLSPNGSDASSYKITQSGTEGELSKTRVNHYRNIGQHLLMLTVSQRPVPQPIASNTDAKTHEQVTLAHGLLDYYSRNKRVERFLKTAAEHSIAFGEGYVHWGWNASIGRVIQTTTDANGKDRPVHEGDVEFSNPTLIDVIKDPYREGDPDWYIVRTFQNRYELVAKYPEMKDKILGKPDRTKETIRLTFTQENRAAESDDIAVYRFYHRKTAAVPNGKLVEFIDSDCVVINTDLPYRDVPIRRIAPGDMIGSSRGYTPMFDLLGIQEAIDALYSAVITNQKSFGVQNILAPDGHNISLEALSGGLNLITYDSKLGKPESLNLTNTPAEIFNFIEQLERTMETLSGINSTVRGNPEASLKSGSALALVQSQAIQFSSGLQSSYAALVEDVFTDLLNVLKDYAKTERVALVVGKYNKHMLKSFTGDNLDGIDRVVVDSGNPLSKTASGRIQIAQDLLNAGMIKTPEEYLSVVITGKIEHMTEADNAELILIRSENEILATGQPTPTTAIDCHRIHIMEHKTVLSSPENRANPAVVEATLAHIQEHIMHLRTVDPAILGMIGEQSLMVPSPMDPAMAEGGDAPQPGAHPEAIPEEPQEAQLPINPATGNQWDPQTGGGVVATEG